MRIHVLAHSIVCRETIEFPLQEVHFQNVNVYIYNHYILYGAIFIRCHLFGCCFTNIFFQKLPSNLYIEWVILNSCRIVLCTLYSTGARCYRHAPLTAALQRAPPVRGAPKSIRVPEITPYFSTCSVHTIRFKPVVGNLKMCTFQLSITCKSKSLVYNYILIFYWKVGVTL